MSTISALNAEENLLNESITAAEDLIQFMIESNSLYEILNEAINTHTINVADLEDAIVMESNMMTSRNAALNSLEQAVNNMSNMSLSGDCAICDIDSDGNGYVNTNDSDLDGLCDDADILGCTNESAINYDASANTDDDSCIQSGRNGRYDSNQLDALCIWL